MSMTRIPDRACCTCPLPRSSTGVPMKAGLGSAANAQAAEDEAPAPTGVVRALSRAKFGGAGRFAKETARAQRLASREALIDRARARPRNYSRPRRLAPLR